jgi:hypothetical protein
MINKIENQCAHCENMATGEILDFYMIDMLNVCDDCLQDSFQEVANEGKEYFYEWACQMYGIEKASYLTSIIYGEGEGEKMTEGMSEYVTIITYGILKYPHNITREGGINIVENVTVRGHKMYLYNNSFPITKMTNNPNDKIYGTLFEVPMSQIVGNYDIIEGYNPKQPTEINMYNRIEVNVELPDGTTKKAQMYMANQNMFAESLIESNVIPTGNFDDRYLIRSFRGKRIK